MFKFILRGSAKNNYLAALFKKPNEDYAFFAGNALYNQLINGSTRI